MVAWNLAGTIRDMRTSGEEALSWQSRYWDFIFEELPGVCAAMDMDKVMAVVNEYNNGNTDFEIDFDDLKSKGLKLIDPESDIYVQARKNVEEGKRLPKIIMTCGGNDFIRSFVHICRDLRLEYGYDVTYEEVPGYAHEWVVPAPCFQ